MRTLDISIERLVDSLVGTRRVAMLDSCGVGHLGSHLLIAGIEPVETATISEQNVDESLKLLEQHFARGLAAVFTLSYDFGRKLQSIESRHDDLIEPDIYVALYDSLIVHDYRNGRTAICGKQIGRNFESLSAPSVADSVSDPSALTEVVFEFSKASYLQCIESIKEQIRRGNTYQTNLTQKLTLPLGEDDAPGDVFLRLRKRHPAPFAAFIDRGETHVISASPERFFNINGRTISTSPIKGTRRRGRDREEDHRLRNELMSSEKDRAENTMIVDLLRNDLGRVCEYGSVNVEKLCDLEEHPTLFHLVSTVEGKLKADTGFSDVLKALFPCGSITGAPKVRTMRIIDELERSPRGLSMGAIGYFIPDEGFEGLRPGFDVSVAIRTMFVRDNLAEFNVGGGITIDSDPESEYAESLLKAKALLSALGGRPV